MLASLAASLAAILQAPAAAGPAALANACEGRDGWSDPAPPARLHGDTYYVGTCGISAILIASPAGHVLIDGATDAAAPHIAANIERLGFRLRDVKLILTSHEHGDHVGGVAALQRLSGATVAARAEAVPALASGAAQAGDPQNGALDPFPAIALGRTVRDGEMVRLGATRLTALATPGHTPGSTSWSWRSCQRRACLTIVYADSVTPVSAEGYRFSDHPDEVAAFRRSLARIGALRCDLLLTPHPGASNLFARLAEGRLASPGGCRAYAARGVARLDERLRQERAR